MLHGFTSRIIALAYKGQVGLCDAGAFASARVARPLFSFFLFILSTFVVNKRIIIIIIIIIIKLLKRHKAVASEALAGGHYTGMQAMCDV